MQLLTLNGWSPAILSRGSINFKMGEAASDITQLLALHSSSTLFLEKSLQQLSIIPAASLLDLPKGKHFISVNRLVMELIGTASMVLYG